MLKRAALMVRDRRSAVALMFGLLALPLSMVVGLAIDFSFYIEEEAQLNTAADTAAIHAVRVASQAYSNGETTKAEVEKAGKDAGEQWFNAQLGSAAVSPHVTVTYTPSPITFTASVTYSTTYNTIFAALFNVSTFNLAGSSTTTITNSYDEIVMLLDNSASMLIGATFNDMKALQNATPCSKHPLSPLDENYSWNYDGGVGYNSGLTPPPGTAKGTNGQCDPRYTGINGDLSLCAYPPSFPNISPNNPYQCTNGGGIPTTGSGTTYGFPVAPCAFACHYDANNNDYYGLARSLPGVQLRLDVVQQAAANVVTTLQTKQVAPNQFSVGIYQFASDLKQVFPTAGSGEAGTNLSEAYTNAANLKNTPNLSTGTGETYFPVAMTKLYQTVSAAGDGLLPKSPLKNLFIVTDGMEDENSGHDPAGPMTSATNEQICSQFWDKGFTVYVLYTPYYPLTHPFYLDHLKQNAEPTDDSADVAALKACARYPSNFFIASDPTAINTAMQTILAAALNSAGRITH